MTKREAAAGPQPAAGGGKKQRMGGDGGASTPSPSPAAATGAASTAAPVKTTLKTCVNCQKDLARSVRVTCVECAPQPQVIEFCVECFAVGIELGEHKKSHRYTVADCLAYPIVLDPSLAADSSAASAAPSAAAGANAVTTAGPSTPLKDRSDRTGTPGTPAAAGGSADWTADEELLLLEGIEMFGMGNWKDIAEHVVTKTEKKCEAHYMNAYLSTRDLIPRFIDDPVEPAVADNSRPDAAHNVTAAAVAATIAAASAVDSAAAKEKSASSQLAGYMPLRGDFDVEYDNEAELVLADMEFSEDDHPTERELKLKVIEIYNQKLDERERRKKFVVERGLLDYKQHQQLERRRPKDEREIIAQMRPFARFQTPEEHERLVEGLIAAMRLRKQILLLQEYRKNGVRTLAETELYDSEKKKRDLEQAIQKQRDSASYLYESGRPVSSSRDRANRMNSRDQNGDASGDSSRTRGNPASTTSAISAIASSFDVDGTPGAHLLTPMEKELCSKLKLLPKV